MKIRLMIVLIMLLITIDQLIKIVIYNYFLETSFVIIPSLFEFSPLFNGIHSYANVLLNDYFNIDLGLWIHVIFFLIYQGFILLFYDFLRSKLRKDSMILDLAIVFQISSMICALIGNLIWEKGTLDYIYLKPLFVFDLKDLFNSCFVVMIPLTLLIHRKQFDSIKMVDLIMHPIKRLKKD